MRTTLGSSERNIRETRCTVVVPDNTVSRKIMISKASLRMWERLGREGSYYYYYILVIYH